ncbi:MAG TPA: ABC transporter permease [Bacillales bacterium]|nr:ABC transporter permease [Bacillales bacterium]
MRNIRWTSLMVPVLSVVFGLIVGGIIMLAGGYNPLKAYVALFQGVVGGPYFIGETIRTITPLILTGLSIAFAFRTGLFNIGAEGQFIVGWFASVFIGITVHAPKVVHLPLALLAAAAVGALWGVVPGILKARWKVHEVIVTIMMNYIALHVTNEWIRHYLKAENAERTNEIQQSASLASPFLQQVTDYSRVHYGIIVALCAAVVMWWILRKTTLGFELRSVGFSSDASKYAGMNVERNIVLSMTISGAFAGLAGAMLGLGTYQYMTINSAGFIGIGFTGIAVSLLGANTAAGVVLAAILFGSLEFGASNMQAQAGVPPEVIKTVMAMIIFFVGSSYFIRWLLGRFRKGEN